MTRGLLIQKLLGLWPNTTGLMTIMSIYLPLLRILLGLNILELLLPLTCDHPSPQFSSPLHPHPSLLEKLVTNTQFQFPVLDGYIFFHAI